MEKDTATGTMTTEKNSVMQNAVRDAEALADHAAKQVGETLKSTAEHARSRVPEEGIPGQIAETVTTGIKQVATRLQEQGFRHTMDEVVAIARRYPVQAALFGLGCVYVLSRLRRD
jgi:uncharacterized protein YidB (DUF937 family)